MSAQSNHGDFARAASYGALGAGGQLPNGVSSEVPTTTGASRDVQVENPNLLDPAPTVMMVEQ